MNKLQLLSILVGLFFIQMTFAQVGIGTEDPNLSAQLEVSSTHSGILIPRVALESTTDRTTIRYGNVNSLMVFNTQTINDVTPGYYYWYTERWYRMANTSDGFDETITTLIDQDGGQFLYTSEDGTETLIDIPASVIENIINEGSVYNEIINLIDTHETITILADHGDGTYTYYNESEVDANGVIIGPGVTIDVVGDVVTNIINQGDIYNEIINILEAESDIFVDNGDGTFTHTAADGDIQIFDANTTTMVNNGDGTYTFTNANGDSLIVDVVGDVITNITNQGDIYDEIINIIEAESDALVHLGNGLFEHTAADGSVVTFDINTVNVENVLDADGNVIGYKFMDAAGDEIVTLNIVADIVNNLINEGDIYNEIVNIIDLNETLTTITLNPDNTHIDYTDEESVLTQLDLTNLVRNLQNTVTIEDGINTTVQRTVTGTNTEYKVNVATADGANLGVVKEAEINPTVNINADGALSVNLENLNAVVHTSVDYIALPTDYTILGDASTGDIDIQLPNATPANKGKKYTIKKLDSNETNYIYVRGNIAGTGGQDLYTAIPYTGWDFISDGTTWHIINAF